MIEVAGVQEGRAASVHTHPVEVHVVRVFARLAGVCGEEDVPLGLVDTDGAHDVERSLGEACPERSVWPVSVEVSPAVGLRPPDQVPVVQPNG